MGKGRQVRQVQQIERALGGVEGFPRQVEVPSGRADRAVAQEDLNRPYIHTGFEQMGREAVAQDVDAPAFDNAGLVLGARKDPAGADNPGLA